MFVFFFSFGLFHCALLLFCFVLFCFSVILFLCHCLRSRFLPGMFEWCLFVPFFFCLLFLMFFFLLCSSVARACPCRGDDGGPKGGGAPSHGPVAVRGRRGAAQPSHEHHTGGSSPALFCTSSMLSYPTFPYPSTLIKSDPILSSLGSLIFRVGFGGVPFFVTNPNLPLRWVVGFHS